MATLRRILGAQPADQDRYSRMVRVLRVVFPVTALILLISIFAISKSDQLRRAMIIPDAQLAELAVGQKITKPHFSGVTNAGDAFSISAEYALPDAPSPERVDLESPRTTLDFKNGRKLVSRATTGQLHLVRNEATMTGDVTIETSDGYEALSQHLIMNFETGNAVSPGPVTATGPLGSIDAGSMELRQDLLDNPSGGRGLLLFKNGVKVIYLPRQ